MDGRTHFEKILVRTSQTTQHQYLPPPPPPPPPRTGAADTLLYSNNKAASSAPTMSVMIPTYNLVGTFGGRMTTTTSRVVRFRVPYFVDTVITATATGCSPAARAFGSVSLPYLDRRRQQHQRRHPQRQQQCSTGLSSSCFPLGLQPLPLGTVLRIRRCSSSSSSNSNRSAGGVGSPRDVAAAGSSSSSSQSQGDQDDVVVGSNRSNNDVATTILDPPMVTWVDRYLPAFAQPYARLSRMDKPIGTWLLLWPCGWSTAMATSTAAANMAAVMDSTSLLTQFAIGAFVMRGAGCTINDLWDRDIDRKVTRTTSRPLAAGQVSVRQAVTWLAVQLSVGLVVLTSLPNTIYCLWWGVASLPLVVVYPLTKRFFAYPQLVLGLTFNWGAWMGWAATMGSMDYRVIVPLYVSGVAWTIVYDTIYANQDKEDDAKLGLQSTALTFAGNGDGTHDAADVAMAKDRRQKKILHAFAAVTYASWLLSGYNLVESSSLYGDTFVWAPYALGVTGAYGHLLWQIQTAQLTPDLYNDGDKHHDPHNLGVRFRSNATVGAMVFGSIVAGKVLPFVAMWPTRYC